MTKTPKRSQRTAPRLSAAEAQAEQTRRALKRSVARAREIKRLSKQLQSANDDAQRALLNLANAVAVKHDFELVPAGRATGTEG